MEIQEERPVTGQIKREWNQSLLILKAEGLYRENYQMKILRANQIEGLLDVRGKGMDGISVYEYDISGKMSLKSMFENNKITSKEMKKCIQSVAKVMENINSYLLEPDALVLEPEYIFCEGEEYSFCYCPVGRQEIRKAFHRLTEFFVRCTDYQDIQSVKIVFMLHKETMEENYSLRTIMERIEEIENEEKNEGKKEDADTQGEDFFTYASEESDWITDQEMGNHVAEETEHFWNPVRRFFQKHRKPRWGEFDGVYVNEEDLED